MRQARWHGAWLAVGVLVWAQVGAQAGGEPRYRVSGPSQGPLPAAHQVAFVLAQAEPGLDQRGPGTQAGQTPGVPGDMRSDDPLAAPGGGGGGGGFGGGDRPSNVIPLLEGNPNGLDAVPTPEPSPPGGGGGGPATDPYMINPFIRVLPGGDAADWTRSPSPGPR